MYAMIIQISNGTHMYAMIILFLRRARGYHCDTVPWISNDIHMCAMIIQFLRLARVYHCDTVPQMSNVIQMYARAFAIFYKSYKNDSRLNRYNFGTVNAIDFLFSTLHTTPFLYGKIDFGILY